MSGCPLSHDVCCSHSQETAMKRSLSGVALWTPLHWTLFLNFRLLIWSLPGSPSALHLTAAPTLLCDELDEPPALPLCPLFQQRGGLLCSGHLMRERALLLSPVHCVMRSPMLSNCARAVTRLPSQLVVFMATTGSKRAHSDMLAATAAAAAPRR